MEEIVWDDKLNIGVEVVDKAHAKLFRIMRKLMDISKEPNAHPNTYKEVVKYLEAYSMTHFAEEEAYMRSIRYKGYAQHKKIHDNFRDKSLVSLKKDLELSNYSQAAVQRVVRVMSGWLTEHIMKEDQAIVGRNVTGKGRDLSSQIAIITRAVNRSMAEVFQTEAKLVSDDYKGQHIGNGYYSCQWYDTEGGLRLQVLLGVEETLMNRGANRLMELQKRKDDRVTNEDVLQVFDQLFKNFSKLFRAEPAQEFSWDNLLERDQFRANFMRGGYPCRLLFSTKTGFFVFCYRSWRGKTPKNEKEPEKEAVGTGGQTAE